MQALVRTLILLVWLPVAVSGQTTERVVEMRAAYANWLISNKTRGTGALAYEGQVIKGIRDASTPIELASVGKSITALCAAALWDQGRLDFSASVRDILGRGPDVSVASLVTHTSGIVDDITQPLMLLWLDTVEKRAGYVLDQMDAPRGTAGVYSYNNVNYALLELVIEAVSGASYKVTCRRLVFNPVLASGAPSPRTGGFLGWGGWLMSPLDFARVHSHWFGAATQTGRDPFAYPHIAIGDQGLHYGLGTFFRKNHTGDGTFNFWHFGAQCFPGRLNAGSYAVTWGGTWTAVLGYDACVDFDTMFDLDAAMGRAAYKDLK
ncbi:MAG: serine hydrolase [Pseudomonadota bacterium]